jgi:hypothetical protein
MKKVLFVLIVGVAGGYFLGFKDARSHRHNVVTRLVNRVGGSNRERFNNDLDAKVDQASR